MNRKLSPSKIKMSELNHVGNGWGWFVDIESCESYVMHKQHVYVGYKKMNEQGINRTKVNLNNPKEFYKINRVPTTSTTSTTTNTTSTMTHEVVIQKINKLTHVTFCLTCITIIIIFIIVALVLASIK